MGWDFERSGSFANERDARDFAERNGIAPSDIRTRNDGGRIELEIRRSAIDGRRIYDRGEGRKDGWT
ncbi:MAG: hypothetical protein JHC57_07950 [Sphingopyxis sp.]|uniref:hypothetical protein n=1 Tax=Sphingopyxis sp. TaxID=1908224 RepID=UPI001A272980|nr:hypothetical protein [Sphingopyxis sp.]MBJ7499669.1 hypothetical protein [Sphingopyxis sp.]